MKQLTPEFQYPPNYDKGLRHRLANRIFKGDLKSEEKCQCCNRKIGEEVVDTECNIDPMKLAMLGPGVPLYFLFLKTSIVMLVLLFLIYGLFAIITNVISNDCASNPLCIQDAFNPLAIVNKQQQTYLLVIQAYLGLVYVVIIIIYFHIFRAQARRLEETIDQMIDSPSDYAIVLRRVPKDVSQVDILKMVDQKRKELSQEDLRKTDNLKVVKVILSFNLRPQVDTRAQNRKIWEKCIQEKRLDQFQPTKMPIPNRTSQLAIVIFEHQISKDFFFHEPTFIQSVQQFFCTACTPLTEMTVKGQKVGIERAPEPDEIYWQNAGITMCGSIGRKVSFGLLSILILFIGGLVQFGLAVATSQVTSPAAKIIMSIINPLFVVLWSQIIMSIIVAVTEKQRNQSVTQFQSVLVVKITILQFLNAGIFVVGTKILAKLNTFDLGGGIIQQACIIMCLNAALPNLTNFVKNYLGFLTKIELAMLRRGWILRSQQEVNKLMSGPIVNQPRRYAYILKTLLLTALYAPSMPIVSPVALIGMSVAYFLQKLLYTTTYGMPHNISSMIFKSSVELLEYFLITFAIGQFIVYAYIYSFQIGVMPTDMLVVIFMSMALAILNSALPMEAFNQWLFNVEQSSRSELKYTEVEDHFEVTYQKLNPSYKVLKGLSQHDKARLVPALVIEDTSNIANMIFGNMKGNSSDDNLIRNIFKNNLGNSNQQILAEQGVQISIITDKKIKETREESSGIQFELFTNTSRSKQGTNRFISQPSLSSREHINSRSDLNQDSNSNQGSFPQLGSYSNLKPIDQKQHELPLDSRKNLK